MLLAEAQSLCPRRVSWEAHDPAADQEQLRRLAHGCGEFSPWVALDPLQPPDSLLLDVTNSDFNYGGELPLLHAVQAWFGRRGYQVVLALTDTWGAAWALAHQPRPEPICIVPPGRHLEALQPLPIELLRLSPETVMLLHQFDIRRIDQLLALPRADLPSRFGEELLRRIDQALGNLPEPLTAERAPEWVEASWTGEPPVEDRQVMQTILSHLLETIMNQLASRPVGVQQLWCLLTLESGDRRHFPVNLSRPSRSVRHLTDLAMLHLERLELSAGIAAVTLRVVRSAVLEYRQTRWFDGDPADDEQRWRTLLERLIGRLGESAVRRVRLCADPQPEWAAADESVTAETTAADVEGMSNHLPLRPIRLLHRPREVEVVSVVPGGPPIRFWWEQRGHDVARCWGPERIETGWWRGEEVRRDYYLVETPQGEWFWLFRSLGEPRWWMHGVFA